MNPLFCSRLRRWACLVCVLVAGGPLAAQPQRRLAAPVPRVDFQGLYDQANQVYYTQHQRQEGMNLYQELEAKARAQGDSRWTWAALWKEAQVWSEMGDKANSIQCFKEARLVMEATPQLLGSASHLSLLGNLLECYRARGQLAEGLKVHWSAETAARAVVERSVKPLGPGSIFDLSDEQLLKVRQFGDMARTFAEEAAVRFESGRDAGALALGQRAERRLASSKGLVDLQARAGLLLRLAEQLDVVGQDAEEAQVLTKLLSFAGPKQFDTVEPSLVGRLQLAWLRERQGQPVTPLFIEAHTVLAELQLRLKIAVWLGCEGTYAQMLAFHGYFREALALLDTAIGQTRSLDEGLLLATLLVTRAELRLDSGSTVGVESDLFEALKWFRLMGGLRAETGAHVQYVRFLRAAGRTAEARAMLADALARLARYPNARLAAELQRETTALGGLRFAGPAVRVGRAPVSASDLQPIQLTTCVAPGEAAQGRFILANPGIVPVAGVLTVKGSGIAARWDPAGLRWEINLQEAGGPPEASQAVVLPPLTQVAIDLTAPAPGTGVQQAVLGWTVDGTTQTNWWRFSAGAAPVEAADIDTNLALANPFYSVPLHHVIRYRGQTGLTQNIRVVTSVPSRVELLDADGRVLAVDATGDGSFDGVGDVLFVDADRNGFPDVQLDAANPVRAVDVLVYPLSACDETDVRIELLDRQGSWQLQSTDRLFSK